MGENEANDQKNAKWIARSVEVYLNIYSRGSKYWKIDVLVNVLDLFDLRMKSKAFFLITSNMIFFNRFIYWKYNESSPKSNKFFKKFLFLIWFTCCFSNGLLLKFFG